jgi:hypothetical protein
MGLCPNTYILFRVPSVNTSSAFAPLPALRRRRQWRAEPVVFAVLLTMLTLGINLSDTNVKAEQADSQPAPSHMAAAR